MAQLGVSEVPDSSRSLARPSTWPAGFGVAAAVVLAWALRLPFVAERAYPDEGGYLLVARDWAAGASGPPASGVEADLGGGLYGDLWVDRPPLLLVFWRIVEAAGGIASARLLGCLLVAGLVVFAGWTGQLVGGRAGAVSASFTAAALASTPALGARAIDGELLAVPWVMAGVTLTLLAVRAADAGGRVRAKEAGWAVLAGLTGTAAALTKQNVVDGLVFTIVLLGGAATMGSLPARAATRILCWWAAGVGVAVVGALAWASTTAAGIPGFWYVLFGFRADAAVVVFTNDVSAPASRFALLGAAALGSGMLFVLVAWAASLRPVRSWRAGDALPVAVAAMLAVGLTTLALGGSYWVHYLVALVPVTAVAMGMLVGGVRERRGRTRRRWAAAASALGAYVVAAAVVAVGVAIGWTYPPRVTEAALVETLAAAARHDDTVFVAYGHPNVVEEAGLTPAYSQLWSLPMRTLDPKLHRLRQTLATSSAPTWLLQWEPLNSWGIDADGRLAATVRERYRLVDTVCGVEIYLHKDANRTMPDQSPSCPS